MIHYNTYDDCNNISMMICKPFRILFLGNIIALFKLIEQYYLTLLRDYKDQQSLVTLTRLSF